MIMMKKLFIILALLINTVTFVQAQDIEGEWTPDESSYLGEIRIKHIEGNKYKVRLQTRDGLQTINATYSNGELFGRFEDEEPNYGEFWVGNGPIENGREKEILVGHEYGRYGTNGAVTGALNGNGGYQYTNSRRNCATVEKSFICVYLYFKGETMTAYYTLRGEYLKNGTPMFYQESGKVNGMNYTKW